MTMAASLPLMTSSTKTTSPVVTGMSAMSFVVTLSLAAGRAVL